MSDKIYRGLFYSGLGFLCLLGVFALGLAIGTLKFWPYEHFQEVWRAGQSLVRHGRVVPEGRTVIPPRGASRERWTVHQPGATAGGYYVFMGFDRERSSYMVWLHGAGGQRLHSWRIDYAELVGEPAGFSGKHGAHPLAVLEDGSIIVAFDLASAMVRLDACSSPVWLKKENFHHSLQAANDGSYWTWRGPNGESAGHFNYLHQFDPETGDMLREIGLVEDVIQPLGDRAQIFGVAPGFKYRREQTDSRDQWDIFHPNDIDVLSEELAPHFPMFEAGDLMVSLRNIHMVAVLDGRSAELKWYRQGPWLFQHDPDFKADGSISVYSNNSYRQRSSIISLNPETGGFTLPFAAGNAPFYSRWMGKHQILPNGNTLIVVPAEGRVLEVDASGDLVLEFNNLSAPGAETNQHVQNGIWLADGFFAEVPGCPGAN